MPLNTQVTREGMEVSLNWNAFHVASMCLAVMFEKKHGIFAGVQPDKSIDYPREPQIVDIGVIWRIVNYSVISALFEATGEYKVRELHYFRDPEDGEELEFQPGDVLKMWRD